LFAFSCSEYAPLNWISHLKEIMFLCVLRSCRSLFSIRGACFSSRERLETFSFSSSILFFSRK
jgi:hypothetical protein